jgi:hypothetical protein
MAADSQIRSGGASLLLLLADGQHATFETIPRRIYWLAA